MRSAAQRAGRALMAASSFKVAAAMGSDEGIECRA
jgi:hypothetical protein